MIPAIAVICLHGPRRQFQPHLPMPFLTLWMLIGITALIVGIGRLFGNGRTTLQASVTIVEHN